MNDPIHTPIATWAIASISGGLLTRVIVAVLTPLYIASPVRDHRSSHPSPDQDHGCGYSACSTTPVGVKYIWWLI